MSESTTPALGRAAEANYLTRAGFRDDAREMYRTSGPQILQSWANATRPVLSAALDVEEMARTINLETHQESLEVARAIRTMILGRP